MKNRYESYWAESEALLALTEGDDEYAVEQIATMTKAEAEKVLHHLKAFRRLLLDHVRSIPTVPEVIAGLREMVREP